MFHWLRRKKISTPDGKYTYHVVPPPGPGTMELVFDQEYQNPVFPLLAGPGMLIGNRSIGLDNWRVLQPPPKTQVFVSPTQGPGGVPVPNQTLDFAPLEDNNG